MDRAIRILILEHDPSDLELLEYELRKSQLAFSFIIVQTEASYTEALSEFFPDIILSDYSLPSFSGIKAFEIKQKFDPNIPFILVSGAIGEENSVELIKLGVTDYVLKDKLFTLLPKMNRALAEAEERQFNLMAEKRLARSEKLLAEAQAMARTGSWDVDIQANEEVWSEGLYNIFGLNPSQNTASMTLFISMIHKDDIRHFRKLMDESLLLCKEMECTFRFNQQDAGVRYGFCKWEYECDHLGRAIRQYGILQDITERVEAEQEILRKNEDLRKLSAYLQEIREDERKNIAREIHDELGQQLTALKMDIAWVMHKGGVSELPANAKLNEMLELSDHILNTVRRISAELRPSIIDDLGLIAALEWRCHDFEEKNGIPCHFSSSFKERKLDNDFAINVFRILQEALTNVIRHAGASNVEVNLSEDDGLFLLTIKDNGKGIDESEASRRNTLGVLGMKERANLLGGQLMVEGTKDKGTKIKLILPLSYENSDS